MNALRAAMVIARRDYVASVWSRTFLLFLIGPLFPVVAGIFFGNVGADLDRKANQSVIAVITDTTTGAAITAARDELAERFGLQTVPLIRIVSPAGDPAAQANALLTSASSGVSATVHGPLAHPILTGPRRVLFTDRSNVAMILDGAQQRLALQKAGADVPGAASIEMRAVDKVVANDATARIMTARLAQLILMMLTMILAGMLLSNLIEEKSNKVIEVLAAAVPVDAIFLGKLLAMLAMSLTGIAVWGGAAAVGIALVVPPGTIPAPAVGWTAFLLLAIVYFVACYLLLGALFLGIGAQASTVREVQTLSMPVTMGQLAVVALASTAVANPGGGLAIGAALFPWSSPFTMLANAALMPQLWPHALAVLWQAVWIALILRIAAQRFRRSVLKSGGGKRWSLFGKRAAVGS